MQLFLRVSDSWLAASPRSFHPSIQTNNLGREVEQIYSAELGASSWSLSTSKRFFDFSVALAVLFLLGLPMLVIAACVFASSKGPALFVQKRVGRRGGLFGVIKFRSMALNSDSKLGLTQSGDGRVTEFGKVMRKFKLDELPQLYNVLRGEMSLVGPRPKLARYEPMRAMPYRPGITGAATLAFRHEEEILRRIHPNQLDTFYTSYIKPLKAQIDSEYMSEATLWTDLKLIFATVLACVTKSEAMIPFRIEVQQSVKGSMQA